jgi:hypothetical protein
MVSVWHPRRPLSPAARLFLSMLAANLRLRAPAEPVGPAPLDAPAP